ncbi:MAG TPA: hypothetical protein H9840_05320 [Candidatus Anaerofilum excrementigallinarum]|nr:hypothetical protein [Candidatus Anaerofilum excrementigallinarum]
MSAFIKRVSRFENRMDALMERFIFHHKLLGLLLIFIGMPFITLAAVCVCTMLIVLPIALLFG